MYIRVLAVIGAVALASLPTQARQSKTHKPATAAVHRPASKARAKKEKAKEIPAAIAKAYAAMPLSERLTIQSDLAWIGEDVGPPGGDFNLRAIEAVKAFQARRKDKQTGILSDEARAALHAAARVPQDAVGWRLIDDPSTGARIGVPTKLVSLAAPSQTGSRWSSGHGQIAIETFGLYEAGLGALFASEKTTHQRRLDWSNLKPDSFVIIGTQGLKNFVVRAQSKGSAVRGITILYDQATEGVMGPVALAMANGFDGFPDPHATLRPGRTVEYSTAIVADGRGDLVANSAATAQCDVMTVAGFGHAERIAADGANGLALLRLYGAHGLVPAPLGRTRFNGDDLTVVGIADPVEQNGGDAVAKTTARLDRQMLAPPPPPGFSGAAAVDAQGRFGGTVEMKYQASANAGPATLQASMVPADAVRAFLSAHAITNVAVQGRIDQSLVRVICVRN